MRRGKKKCLRRASNLILYYNFKLFCFKGWNTCKKKKVVHLPLDEITTKTVIHARFFQKGCFTKSCSGIFSGTHRPHILHPLSSAFGSSGLTALFSSACKCLWACLTRAWRKLGNFGSFLSQSVFSIISKVWNYLEICNNTRRRSVTIREILQNQKYQAR